MTAATAAAFRDQELYGPTKPWQNELYIGRLKMNVLAQANRHQFRADFYDWLAKNEHVYLAFEAQADRIWASGRRRYSARTIGEYLRHESALREAPNEHGFKVNDHWWPDLARLYMLAHPEREGFFERRAGPATLRSA